MRSSTFLRFARVAAFGLVLTAFFAGCHVDSSRSAQFIPSRTPAAPGLVKLVLKAQSGTRVVVDVLLNGPAPDLDLNGFQFGIKIGDTGVVRFVPQSTYAQSALVAEAGQTIAIDVDGESDPSLILVDIKKLGGGPGNGLDGRSAVVLELGFDVQADGSSALTLVGVDGNPARALDSSDATIAAVAFDEASAGVTAATSGGSGY
ncbi:MAG TPA: hypothetical protein VF139_06065 [Candidatus Polarisedimenticolaceae bacterium]